VNVAGVLVWANVYPHSQLVQVYVSRGEEVKLEMVEISQYRGYPFPFWFRTNDVHGLGWRDAESLFHPGLIVPLNLLCAAVIIGSAGALTESLVRKFRRKFRKAKRHDG